MDCGYPKEEHIQIEDSFMCPMENNRELFEKHGKEKLIHPVRTVVVGQTPFGVKVKTLKVWKRVG